MAINTGPRSRARRWAQAIYDAYPDVQGISYPSSMHANRPAIALWERAAEALSTVPVFHRPLVDPALLPVLSRVAREFGYGLV